jgi:parvulin-like peptidyl-prolyl isomerase
MHWTRAAIIMLAVAGASCSKQSDDATSAGEWPQHGLTEAQAREVLVKVGDRTITVGEFADRLASQSPYLQARFESPERRREFLDNLVRYELLVYEARRRGYGNDADVLRTQRNLMIQELIKQEVDVRLEASEVSDEEVQAAYEANPTEFDRPAQVRVSHILVKGRKRAQQILSQTKDLDRAGFTALARERSEDDDTRADGGNLGFFTADAEEPSEAVRNAAFTMKMVGEVYPELVEDSHGFHILMLTGKRAELKRTYEQAQRAIRHKLTRERKDAAMEALTKQLRSEIEVEIDYDALDDVRVDVSDLPGEP